MAIGPDRAPISAGHTGIPSASERVSARLQGQVDRADTSECALPGSLAGDGAAGLMIYSRVERAECSNGSMESARS